MALAEHESELEGVEVFSALECTDHTVEGSPVGAQCKGLSDGACHSSLTTGLVFTCRAPLLDFRTDALGCKLQLMLLGNRCIHHM